MTHIHETQGYQADCMLCAQELTHRSAVTNLRNQLLEARRALTLAERYLAKMDADGVETVVPVSHALRVVRNVLAN